jgi:TetR/AcrR family transcriptional regulator, transcriptional repressor for nem operon
MSRPRKQPDRTRARLVEVGFEEIYSRGFQPASVDAIVNRAGVTKGALYHHFPSKLELGYAVLDEVIGGFTDQRWLRPIAGEGDPIEAIINSIRTASMSDFEFGCPLNNLAQEMSTVDAEFHRRIAALYRRWESGVVAALARGQAEGSVRSDVDVAAAATFVVASIEGAYGLAKNRKDRQPLDACVEGLARYLGALRSTRASVGTSTA